MMLNTSTSLISDVVDQDSESSAFVYGFYSFMDKIANGIMLFFLVSNYAKNEHALRWIISVIPMICAYGTTFFTWIGFKYFADKMAKISW